MRHQGLAAWVELLLLPRRSALSRPSYPNLLGTVLNKFVAFLACAAARETELRQPGPLAFRTATTAENAQVMWCQTWHFGQRGNRSPEHH